MNSLRAAASPSKKQMDVGSPRTPRKDEDLGVINAVTPMKRVPILANFEEWMKMATDNVGYDEWNAC